MSFFCSLLGKNSYQKSFSGTFGDLHYCFSFLLIAWSCSLLLYPLYQLISLISQEIRDWRVLFVTFLLGFFGRFNQENSCASVLSFFFLKVVFFVSSSSFFSLCSWRVSWGWTIFRWFLIVLWFCRSRSYIFFEVCLIVCCIVS